MNRMIMDPTQNNNTKQNKKAKPKFDNENTSRGNFGRLITFQKLYNHFG